MIIMLVLSYYSLCPKEYEPPAPTIFYFGRTLQSHGALFWSWIGLFNFGVDGHFILFYFFVGLYQFCNASKMNLDGIDMSLAQLILESD
jgi:hypothetical protein